MLVFRIAALKRAVRQLADVAEARAEESGHAKSVSTRRARFRLLTEVEAEAILGADLLAALAAMADRS